MLTSVQHVDLLCQRSAGLDTQHQATFFLSNSADFCVIGLWERFLKIWAMTTRRSSLSSNQHSFPTDHILACDRETSKLAMLMQPSNMQASVPGVARQWTDKGNTTMQTWKQEITARRYNPFFRTWNEKTTYNITLAGLSCSIFVVFMRNCNSNTLLQYNIFTSKTTNITISHVDHLKESKITDLQLRDSMSCSPKNVDM